MPNNYTTSVFLCITLVCAGIQICIGLIALFGWIAGLLLLASIRPDFIPMAPGTAIIFIAMGSAFIILVCWPIHFITNWFAKFISFFIIFQGLLTLIQYFFCVNFGIVILYFGSPGTVGMAPLGIMSPITAANFLLAGVSLLLSLFIEKKCYKNIASSLAAVVIIVGSVVILGYLYRTPLLYGGTTVPMALTTAIAFVFLGVGLIVFIGKQYWPLCLVVGSSTHARLMRTFLPITVFIVLLEGWVYTYIFCKPKNNPALISALLVILLVVIVGVLVSRISNIIANTIDSAEKKRRLAEEKLHKLSHAIEQSSCPIIITNTKGDIEYINPKFTQLTGYTLEEVLGQNPRILRSGDTKQEQYTDLWNTITSGKEWRGEFHNRKKNGELYWEQALISPIRNSEGMITHFVAIKEDVTERKNLEAKLTYTANHDSLTNLFNRHYLCEELEKLLALSERYGTSGALLFLDVDNFKYINDTLGHAAGDKLLMQIADLLKTRLRKTDIVARLGGDEFAILLPHTDTHKALFIAKQIVELIQHQATVQDIQSIGITTSIGIAMFPKHGDTVKTLLTHADLAMYQAKEKGRNRVCIFRPNQKTKIELRVTWEKCIRNALKQNGFVLYLQPILDLHQNSIIGYEALLRMIDENGKLISPSQFLKTAECFGLIYDIDIWVIYNAIHLIERLHKNNKPTYLEVNLSSKAFSNTKLISLIREELVKTRINPADLVFEITETAVIENIAIAQNFINDLKTLGCKFALDDFGTGFSSFNYLKCLSVNYLKIDGVFIQNLQNNIVDQHLVKAMVDVAHALGKKTIAEFVDSEKTIPILQKLGIDYAQGYYIGKPYKVS